MIVYMYNRFTEACFSPKITLIFIKEPDQDQFIYCIVQFQFALITCINTTGMSINHIGFLKSTLLEHYK